ncbi:N-acetylglucosamine-6-phosphate deacetylase [Pontibacillus salicampi]|uniref:N-acetylglucosamine-6-phosphate deacetylase n=1 Tax=Pontibacillus salicampi TaxID=1449801 RepID=A0ABV6LQL8_9BACI
MFYLQGDVLTDGQLIRNQVIEIENEMITYIGDTIRNKGVDVITVENGYICPGLVDIHIHGIDGVDFMDKGRDTWETITEHLPRYGVTACLATSRTAPLPDIQDFLDRATAFTKKDHHGTRLIGVHVEGPWISKSYCGAQDTSLIRSLTWQDVKEVLSPYFSLISKLTIAPEEVQDPTILSYLHSQSIILSAGHTNATLEQMEEAIESGISQITHTFNAMSPIHHRTPGTAAAALYFDLLLCEVIADGVHLHPAIIQLLYKIKGAEGIALISDCTGYNHLTEGEYVYRGRELIRRGGEVRLKNGSLAGSAITLVEAVSYVVKHCGIPIEEAIRMATEIPARATGTTMKIGRVQPNYRADFVVLTEDLEVNTTWIGGLQVYNVSGN